MDHRHPGRSATSGTGTGFDTQTAPGEVTAAMHAVHGPTAMPGGHGTAPERLSGNQVLAAALTLLRELREELAGWEPQLIEAARALNTSWADLAPALGVASRQAAERRYLRLRPAPDGTSGTGDERVAAERDKRAGDKAVATGPGTTPPGSVNWPGRSAR